MSAYRPDGDLAPSTPGLPAGLQRAVAWLGRHLDEPIRLDTLAAIAGLRPRTLETQFRRHLGTTPLGWVRRLRLARARQQLLLGGATTVTEVAEANGITELGRFAAEYRRRFGELPSATLRAAQLRPPPSAAVDDEAVRLSWRAVAPAFVVGPGSCGAAIEDAEHAMELAPGYALPRAIAAWCWTQRAAHNFTSTPDLDRRRALQLAREAEHLAPHDALALTLASGAMTLAHRLADAERLTERSLAIDPWSPWAWVRRGWLSAYVGDYDAAQRELGVTLRLMPFEPLRHLLFIGIGCAHFGAARYERAARWVQDGVAGGPESFWAERVLVAAAAHAGTLAEARRAARRLLRKDPDLTVERVRRAWPFTTTFLDRLGDGLQRAGVPAA